MPTDEQRFSNSSTISDSTAGALAKKQNKPDDAASRIIKVCFQNLLYPAGHDPILTGRHHPWGHFDRVWHLPLQLFYFLNC